MRCRSGDMAVLVRNTRGIECMRREMGATIRVHEYAIALGVGVVWREKGGLKCRHCGADRYFLDADLQPIRGDGREDESVREIIAEHCA